MIELCLKLMNHDTSIVLLLISIHPLSIMFLPFYASCMVLILFFPSIFYPVPLIEEPLSLSNLLFPSDNDLACRNLS